MKRNHYWTTALLLLGSGFAGLVYEVLWMRQLGLLFGNTSHAAAATLAAFFSGLAAGSAFWGRRSPFLRNPLRGYGLLEIGVATSALLYFVILHLFHLLYPVVVQTVGTSSGAVVIKFFFALLLIFPPAFFMGGTIPLMSQHLIRDTRRFGATASLLYGINTLGAAAGAYMTGFHLPIWLGCRGTYALAMGTTLCVAALAFQTSRARPAIAEAAAKQPEDRSTSTNHIVAWLSFASGFGVLGLEVLWTRMFAQVLCNSVYTFAAILVATLTCLALGAGIASWLARTAWQPTRVLCIILAAAGLVVGITPFLFVRLTDQLHMLTCNAGWGGYLFELFKRVVFIIFLPGCLLGTVFPYLLKISEHRVTCAGRAMGDLSAVNTVGAILGSLFAGFLLLDWLGLWMSIFAFCLLYLLMAVLLAVTRKKTGVWLRLSTVAATLSAIFLLNPSGLPRISLNEAGGVGETIVELWDGSGCTVAVTSTFGALAIKVDNHYGLGSMMDFGSQEAQARIPLFARKSTRNIFFLGMGTGISAGAALSDGFTVERIVTCELVPEVVHAAKKYFDSYLNGLFNDPRSTVLAEDGRHYLATTEEHFDLINADLFVPYRSGAGSLYTLEHFQSVKEHLNPGGTFVQWLPLYQVTQQEFGIVARTLLEVFPRVTLWRNNFFPEHEAVALIGHVDETPMSPFSGERNRFRDVPVKGKGVEYIYQLGVPKTREMNALFYCGNLTQVAEQFDAYPINSDNRPYIEYLAPRSLQQEARGEASWFVSHKLVDFLNELQRICPPESDPYLADCTPEEHRLVRAGLNLYETLVYSRSKQEDKAQQAWSHFQEHWAPPVPKQDKD